MVTETFSVGCVNKPNRWITQANFIRHGQE